MGMRERFMSGLARQLGRPEGIRGRIVGRGLNKGNLATVSAAVAATELGPGQVAADVGFGGGLGLQLLLERVGPQGRVVGVELSDTMRRVAARRFRAECADGRMAIHAGTLGDLPLEGSSVDALITTNTVYFVEDLQGAFSEIARVLRPTGRAVIGVADPDWMASMPVTAHGFRLRPIDELVNRLHQAGFAEVRDVAVERDERPFRLLVAGAKDSSSHP
jgi:arsenite methyltransferase